MWLAKQSTTMNTELDHQNCVLCNNNITRNENYSKESQLEFNNSQHDPLNSQLKIVFLIRKILGIPQDICCTFLEEYGDPNSWVGCCDSCSVLIEDGKLIFDQIMMLQKQFKALKNQIKGQIIGNQMERKFGEGQGRVVEIIRSYICKESTFVKEENTEKHLSYSEVDVHESNFCLHAANYDIDTVIVHNEVESDVYPPGVSITESKADYFFEETDPLGPDENVKVKDDNFGLDNDNGAHHIQIILPKSEPAFDSETSNIVSSIFYDESEAANFNKPETCGNLCTSGSDLAIHQRTYTAEKPYECLICGKCFVDNSSFKHHTNMHTSDFSQSAHLTRNTNSHSGKNPYKCNVCGKCFSELGQLTRHTRMHTGEKPFKCNVCGKCFSQSSSLIRHKRSHTGEKPFKCDICGKCFSQSCDLIRHERCHTGEKPFKCDVCGKGFTQQGDVTRHKTSHTQS